MKHEDKTTEALRAELAILRRKQEECVKQIAIREEVLARREAPVRAEEPPETKREV
jgi:hypothetical protein